jgi:hypothetical protein
MIRKACSSFTTESAVKIGAAAQRVRSVSTAAERLLGHKAAVPGHRLTRLELGLKLPRHHPSCRRADDPTRTSAALTGLLIIRWGMDTSGDMLRRSGR